MQQLILGSNSPRRREILGFFSIPFTQASPNFDEDAVPYENPPEDFVCRLSLGKAKSLASLHPHAIILTADTIVYREGKIYGKPKDRQDAHRILRELSGEWHEVYTGITLTKGDKVFSKAEKTRVLFNPLTDQEISHYHNSIECSDKAGAYGIQQGGGVVIRKIEGCFYNVMGLPINTLRELFSNIGIDLWRWLR